MKCFFVPKKNKRYFYDSNNGICEANNLNDSTNVLFDGGCDEFGFWENDKTHIICTDMSNNILYLVISNHKVSKYELCHGKENIIPRDFNISFYDNVLYIFYKVFINDKCILFSYIPKNYEFPKQIATLSLIHSDYCAYKNRIYYTDESENLCSLEIGSKPNIICENAYMPCAATINGSDSLIYIKDNCIVLNGEIITQDEYANNPVIFMSNGKSYIEWKSSGFVKYVTFVSSPKFLSSVAKFLGNGKSIILFNVFANSKIIKCYGVDTKPFIYPSEIEHRNSISDSNLEQAIIDIKKEVDLLREEIRRMKK